VMRIHCIVLVGGRGSRFGNELSIPKYLHPIGAYSSLERVMRAITEIDAQATIVVSPRYQSAVRELLTRSTWRVELRVQAEPRGTLHALRHADATGPVAVILADCVVDREAFFHEIQAQPRRGTIGCGSAEDANRRSTQVESVNGRVAGLAPGDAGSAHARWTGRIYFPAECPVYRQVLASPCDSLARALHQIEFGAAGFYAVHERGFVNINDLQDLERARRLLA